MPRTSSFEMVLTVTELTTTVRFILKSAEFSLSRLPITKRADVLALSVQEEGKIQDSLNRPFA